MKQGEIWRVNLDPNLCKTFGHITAYELEQVIDKITKVVGYN